MFDRLHRSCGLAAECWRLLLQDRRLLVFPLLSALAIVVLIASFALPLATFAVLILRGAAQSLSTLILLALLAFYWLQFAIVIFFNTALVAAAMKRFDGEQAGIGEGLRRAFALLPATSPMPPSPPSSAPCCAALRSGSASSPELSSV